MVYSFKTTIAAMSQCNQEQLDVLDYLSNHLDVRFEVLRNFDSDHLMPLNQVNLTNAGERDISSAPVQWSVYFAHSRMIQYTIMRTKNGSEIPNSGLTASMLLFSYISIRITTGYKRQVTIL